LWIIYNLADDLIDINFDQFRFIHLSLLERVDQIPVGVAIV